MGDSMILALTGAGISKASGIPTFEEQGDLRNYLSRDYANNYPKKFKKLMNDLDKKCIAANPNDAHYALAEYKIPIITMNIDSLHLRAGSEHILEVHGSLRNKNVVLYGDEAPLYKHAYNWADRLNSNDVLLIIGTSLYTRFSREIVQIAENHNAEIITINQDAEHKVRTTLEENRDKIGSFVDFVSREPNWIRNYKCYFY